MATLTLKTMMTALLAGSLAATAGGVAFAKADGPALDPAKMQTRIEKRVDRALESTDATAEQKQKVSAILKEAFKDLRGLHDKRTESRKAMEAALQAATIDPARIEAIRVEQMKVADEASKSSRIGARALKAVWGTIIKPYEFDPFAQSEVRKVGDGHKLVVDESMVIRALKRGV